MRRKDFKVGDRVRLGARKGIVNHIYRGIWDEPHADVEFEDGYQILAFRFLEPIEEFRERRAVNGTEALAVINRYRGRKGQPLLDPKKSGWLDRDLIDEYERLVEGGFVCPLS